MCLKGPQQGGLQKGLPVPPPAWIPVLYAMKLVSVPLQHIQVRLVGVKSQHVVSSYEL